MNQTLDTNTQANNELTEILESLSEHLIDPIYRLRLISELINRGYDKTLIIEIMQQVNPKAFDDTSTKRLPPKNKVEAFDVEYSIHGIQPKDLWNGYSLVLERQAKVFINKTPNTLPSLLESTNHDIAIALIPTRFWNL